MTDIFAGARHSLESPATHAAAIVPNDAADLPISSRALYVGSVGDLAIITVGGSSVTLKSVSGWVPIRVARVNAAGTTASDIVAIW